MRRHFTLYHYNGRIALLDNTANVHALLTMGESRRFHSIYGMLEDLRGDENDEVEEFFHAQMEKLCETFLKAAA